MSEQWGVKTGRKLETLLAWLQPFEKAIVERTAGEVYHRLVEVMPIVLKVAAELEKLRRWEKVYWFPIARTSNTDAVLAIAESYLEDAEKAEEIALAFTKAFLSKMEHMDMPMRWEDAQYARMLLLFMCKALSCIVDRYRETVEREGA